MKLSGDALFLSNTQ